MVEREPGEDPTEWDECVWKEEVEKRCRQLEREVQAASGNAPDLAVNAVLSPADVLSLQQTVDQVYVDIKIKSYVLDLVHATRRPGEQTQESELRDLVHLNTILMLLQTKARLSLKRRQPAA